MGGHDNDDDLVGRLLAEHERAYRAAWLILRDQHLAEDAVQEAFLRVWRFRDALPVGEAIRPWLYRVVVNTSISMWRKERPRVEKESAAQVEPAAQDPLDRVLVADALGTLPEHLRIPVVLRYWVGLSEKEIATAIQRRPGTVKSRLHEARARLSDGLREEAR